MHHDFLQSAWRCHHFYLFVSVGRDQNLFFMFEKSLDEKYGHT